MAVAQSWGPGYITHGHGKNYGWAPAKQDQKNENTNQRIRAERVRQDGVTEEEELRYQGGGIS